MSLRDKESAYVSAVIPVHASGKQCQSSAIPCKAPLLMGILMQSLFTEWLKYGGIVGANGIDNCGSGYDCFYGWDSGLGLWVGCYGRLLLMVYWKKDHQLCLCDKLCCKILIINKP